jgi:hypothetical protein
METNKKNISSEKSFGLVFFTVFIVVSYYFYGQNTLLFWTSLTISLFFLVTAVFFKKILTKPNIVWFKFGILLSKITSPIIMVLLYFVVITPTGIFYFFKKQKQYEKKISKKKMSYWIIREKPVQSMDNQY